MSKSALLYSSLGIAFNLCSRRAVDAQNAEISGGDDAVPRERGVWMVHGHFLHRCRTGRVVPSRIAPSVLRVETPVEPPTWALLDAR